jgi:bifunctional ADP-heptose synthase (sugar kinase/adenylyltransferase)
LRVVTVVQQIMTEFNDAVSEEDKIVISDHYKNCLKSHIKMATRVHKPLNIIAFNASGTGRKCYGLSIQLQG